MINVSKAIERKFWKALCKVFNAMFDRVKKGVPVERAVRTFTMTPEVNSYLTKSVNNMITMTRQKSARSWREAATKGSRGREIYDLLKEELKGPVGRTVDNIVKENAQYIKTIPNQWTQWVTDYIYRETMKGKRPEEIEKELRSKLPDYATRNLKCVARTEAAKANAAITEARSYALGIRAYIWRCVRDERSRDSHVMMDGVLVFYEDPPNPEKLFPRKGVKPYGSYHAGNTFNCRCYQEPVVDDDLLPESIRVHDHGHIKTMTRREIRKKYGKIAT